MEWLGEGEMKGRGRAARMQKHLIVPPHAAKKRKTSKKPASLFFAFGGRRDFFYCLSKFVSRFYHLGFDGFNGLLGDFA